MAASTAPQIEIYWMPGCSSCLRLKEFVEKSGKPFTAINVEAEPDRAGLLRSKGMRVPALCVGDTCVNGVHLATVAELIGVEYDEPRRLSPAELRDRYLRALDVLTAVIPQISPDRAFFALPGRERGLAEVAGHAACVMRYFLGKYDDADFAGFFDDLEPTTRVAAELEAFLLDTRERFESWWSLLGHDDPLDDVVPLYWGHRTMHEALEREVWHTAQHTRQVVHMLELSGATPTDSLTPDDLAGLPVPERVFD